jgi:hypothetical protein
MMRLIQKLDKFDINNNNQKILYCILKVRFIHLQVTLFEG